MDFSLQRSDMKRFDLFISHDIALPLERESLVGREVYKHLAPLEPEH
jgi:hypothetical protein